MATRNTARCVLRSDTAPDRRLLELGDGTRESASGTTTRSRTGSIEQLDQLENRVAELRRDFTASQDNLRVEVTAELSNLNSSIGVELTEIKGHLVNLVHSMTNMSTTLNQTQASAEEAQQIAIQARTQVQLFQTNSAAPVPTPNWEQAPVHPSDAQLGVDVNMMSPDTGSTIMHSASMDAPRLRKLDVSPPTFDGLIDGIKLNSFLFQFESYFQQKGVMKSGMIREFREPNFQAKVRNQLLKMKQTGGYHGYVNKFRELQRIVKLDELTAINVFVNGLTNAQVSLAIQRKQPTTLTAAVQEGFLEWELQGIPPPANQKTLSNNRAKRRTVEIKNEVLGKETITASPLEIILFGRKRLRRGVHKEEDCWVLHPEKKPHNLQKKRTIKLARPLEAERSSGQEVEQLDPVFDITCTFRDVDLHDHGGNEETEEKFVLSKNLYCLLHTQSTVQCFANDICIVNSNFIDSGATIDGVSPQFCATNGLWDKIEDHNEPMEITLAAKQKMTVPTKTITLTVYMEDFEPYTNDFLVIDVPEKQDILLGMPWLKTVNPDIDWVKKRVNPRVVHNVNDKNDNLSTKKRNSKTKVKILHKPERPAVQVGGKRQPVSSLTKKYGLIEYFKHGYYSATSGTTKFITSKQFRRMLKKSKTVECIFVIRPKTEKESSGHAADQVDIETFDGHPIYPVLLKHEALFKQKLPSVLPPREHDEHAMEVDTQEAIFRRQWRQSPGQEKVITDWVSEMKNAGLIRTSTSPHGAPTFCVRKPIGLRKVHDYRALNSHTIRRTLPMPRKDIIIEKMQGACWYSCMDLLSGYYQFRMRDCDIPYTAFQTPDGSYEYLVLPMRLSNAPATFNEGIRRILADLSDICYFDDIYVYSRSKALDVHLEALDRVLTRLENHNFYVKLSKCVFCVDEIPCLGDYVGRDGVRIDPKKLEILQGWPLPCTRSELQSFLGTAVYIQRFCRDFACDAGPLFDMLKGPTKKSISRTDDLRSHFLSLKAKIASPPVLAIPDFDKPFWLRMDASDHAIGGVLFQEEVKGDELVERPIAFGGRKYKDGENNYSIREKELLAILFGLRLWRVYLLDKPFVVETDHRSLETIFTQKTISRRVARWYDELSEYPITFRYIRGDTNTVADGISRRTDFMRGATTTLTAITSRKEICKHIDRGLASLVKEATDRYADDSFTSSLAQQQSARVTPDKPSIRHFERYSRGNKQVFYQAPSDEQPRLALLNITEIIDALLYEFHDAKHPGIERTIRLVEKAYYWRYMER
ncbi:LOW QUALITY PROTEIN: Reverse transcriptase [Phytophthora palmivora]|uniref:RNA-directed DNA polymerase n=1 Tax=Phytophthora palmivora TaxID=4796 RepID=A0A2P4YKV8_9STRA|nr:LOW QUALITY PROTEIN: Reverse transcriptase [Phytophthora palmivora]